MYLLELWRILIPVAIIVILLYEKVKSSSTVNDTRLELSPANTVQPLQPSKIETCSSVDCIRCFAYKTLLNTVNIKLDKYLKQFPSHDDGIERLCTGIKTRKEILKQWEDCASCQQPNVLYIPGLSASAWRNDIYMEQQDILKKNFKLILKEFEVVCEIGVGWSINSVSKGVWHVFHLINQGKWITDNCKQCPDTLNVLNKLENLMTGNVFANALFSALEPGTMIEEHCGPTNTRLRLHLGNLLILLKL